MRRFSILVTEIGVPEYELCQVDTNPDEIVKAAKAHKRQLHARHGSSNSKYTDVRIRDNSED